MFESQWFWIEKDDPISSYFKVNMLSPQVHVDVSHWLSKTIAES